MSSFNHLLKFSDLSDKDWNELYLHACDILKDPEKYARVCEGKILATLFFEPSTRTQLSFQTAMLRLGGKVIGFSDPSLSSVSKGESLKDTVQIVSQYSDLIAIRNSMEGSALAASLYSDVPVINAGDGAHQHPTQTITDLFTILHLFGTLDGLTIGICGDLLNGRTVHSLCSALSKHKNTIYLISTKELQLPDYCLADLKENNEVHFASSIEDCLYKLDIIYMTRIQKERFSSMTEYEKQSGIFKLDEKKMLLAKKDMIILHPLPKVDEISPVVDNDPRAKYFLQAKLGMYIRMALIDTLINQKFTPSREKTYEKTRVCKSPKCVTAFEGYLPPLTEADGEKTVCAFCNKDIL